MNTTPGITLDWGHFAALSRTDRLTALEAASRDITSTLGLLRAQVVADEADAQANVHGRHGSQVRAAREFGLTPGRVTNMLRDLKTGQVHPLQTQALWHGVIDTITRGPDHTTLTRDTLTTLMSGSGITSDDWDGEHPAPHMWTVLAEILSGAGHMEATDSHQTQALYRVSEAEGAYELWRAAREALDTGCALASVAAEANTSEEAITALLDGPAPTPYDDL